MSKQSHTLLRPIGDCEQLIHLGPPVAHPESSLVDVVNVWAADPRPGVVLVTDAADRLAGWIPELRLDSDLLLMVLPEEARQVARELDPDQELLAARGLMQTAADLMSEASTVTAETPVKEALVAMMRGGTRVVALVDSQQRLLGYVTLMDIMRDVLIWGG